MTVTQVGRQVSALGLVVAAAAGAMCAQTSMAADSAAPSTTAGSVPAPHEPHYAPDTAFMAAPAGHYTIDPLHAFVSFQLAHLGGLSNPILMFRVVQAEYDWDPVHPEATRVTAKILPTSLDSGSKDFDMRMNDRDVLRGNDMLTAGGIGSSLYRWITFEGTQVNFSHQKSGTMTGNLTLVGVTKPVTMDITYNGYELYENWPKMGFSVKGLLHRSDFGITAKPTASDEVAYRMELEFVRVQPSTEAYLKSPK
jgi:polyisoprenoid-binding protein YceI